MLNQPTPDIFQTMQAAQLQPQAVPVTGNALFKPIAEGVQALGDNMVALIEGALNKIVNFGSSVLSGRENGDAVVSTGRYEDPGFSAAAAVVAAATPATRGQSIEAPQISAPSRDVSLAQLGDLVPTPIHFGIGPSQGQGQGIS